MTLTPSSPPGRPSSTDQAEGATGGAEAQPFMSSGEPLMMLRLPPGRSGRFQVRAPAGTGRSTRPGPKAGQETVRIM